MRFGWFAYIIGMVAIGIGIGFLIPIFELAALSLMILLFVWAFLFPFIAIKKAIKKARKPFEELINSPEQTTNAKVFGKTTKTSGGDWVSNGDEGVYTTPVITSHFISFEFDSRRENFEVGVSLYNVLKEGETGTLTYKEHNNDLMFIDFKPNR